MRPALLPHHADKQQINIFPICKTHCKQVINVCIRPDADPAENEKLETGIIKIAAMNERNL